MQCFCLQKRQPHRTWMGITLGGRRAVWSPTDISSQVADPHRELSMQQTIDFLANFDAESNFPQYDVKFEQVLTQIDQQSTSLKKPNCESVMEDDFPEYDAEFEQILTQIIEQQSTRSSIDVTNKLAKRFASPKKKKQLKLQKSPVFL